MNESSELHDFWIVGFALASQKNQGAKGEARWAVARPEWTSAGQGALC